MKKSRRPLPVNHELPIVIIGSGPVGDRLARELLRRAPKIPIVVFEGEQSTPYDRINLVKVLTGELDWVDIENAVPGRTGSEYIRHHSAISAIDRAERTVTDLGGRQQPYSFLTIATGARAFLPDIPGINLKNVLTFRHKADVEALTIRRQESHRIAVMGGGVLGVEVACGLRKMGAEVCIVQTQRLLARQMDAKGSVMVLAHMRALGIEVVLDRTEEILGEEAVNGIRMFGGQVVECDTIVVATGVQPVTDLALTAGLRIGRGIKVNDHMQTSDPMIYAVGDCAEHRGRVYGLLGTGFDHAAVAAKHILGGKSRFKQRVIVTRLKGVELPAVTVSRLEVDPPQYDELEYDHPQSLRYRKLLLHRGRVQGAIAVGEWPELWQIEEAAQRGRRLWPWQQRRFRESGNPWLAQRPLPVAEWPAGTTVCNCRGISRGALSRVLQEGQTTIENLSGKTGAGTGCGKCKPLLAALLGVGAAGAAIERKSFAVACAVALLLVFLIVGLPHWPAAGSVRGQWHPEILWQDRSWRQASGYGLLSLSFLAVTLSLRKRWINFVRFGKWRRMHTLIGIAALILLGVHTGLHLGRSPLNVALMFFFLGICLSGAIAGTSLVMQGRMLSNWTRYHAFLFWPLPVLLTFHILSSYYF
ncbi:MAG TPA: FAD-dependent oxidoreductase [Methylocella sp.]|nr:FAD-dependent oxidoreductase [Methylocella sp.]